MFLIVNSLSSCGPQVRHLERFDEEPDINVELAEGEIETMGLEEYVTGVVAGEMKPDWPESAYAAQAILARTFALKYLEEHETDTISSDYLAAQEYKPENITEEVETGVAKTTGEVIVYNDQYINAWFHASAGGQTTFARVGLAYERDEPPYTISVSSPDHEAPDDVQNWVAVFSNEELQQTLNTMEHEIGEIESLETGEMDETGRVIDFIFTGTEGNITVKAAIFRRELDSQRLKSTKITEVEETEEGYSFSGSGFGHGVGMSQWGAYSMAKEGNTPEEIVDYYFDGIEIVSLYD